MANLFGIFFLASLLLLVIGLFKPATALFWKKPPVTRRQAITFYGIVLLATIAGIGVTAPDHRDKRTDTSADTDTSAPPTATDMERTLAKSCDTTWRFIDRPEKYLNDTGYIIDPFDVRIDGKDWEKGPWTMPTYKQTGPATFDDDDKRRLTLYQPVKVLKTQPGHSGEYDHHFLLVSPLGSNEQYWITDTDITLKNVNQCTLLQKARNGFFARAEFIAPADPNRRPTNDADGKWIDVPAHARIKVSDYNNTSQTIDATIYDAEGDVSTPNARFFPETLKEIK